MTDYGNNGYLKSSWSRENDHQSNSWNCFHTDREAIVRAGVN